MVCKILLMSSIKNKGDTIMQDQIETLLQELTYEQKLLLFEYLERRASGAGLPDTQATA